MPRHLLPGPRNHQAAQSHRYGVRPFGIARNLFSYGYRNRHNLANLGRAAYRSAKGVFRRKRRQAPPATKPKVARAIAQGASQHNDTSSRSFVSTIRKGTKKPTKTRFMYMETWQLVSNSAESQQEALLCKCIGSRDQVIGNTSNLRSSFFSIAESPYELNPYRANGGSATFPAGAAGTPMQNDKLYYRSVFGKLSLLNMANLASHVRVYWCLAKVDTGNHPVLTWQGAIGDMAMGSANPLIASLTTTPAATPGFATRFDPGTSPLSYAMFRKTWKVLHMESFNLQGGDEVDVSFKFNYNRYITKSELSQRPTLFLKGISIVPFVVYYGSMCGVGDGPPAPTAATEVVYGQSRIGVIVQQTHVFEPVPAETKTPTSQVFYGLVSAPSHAIDERIIDDTDAVTNIDKL